MKYFFLLIACLQTIALFAQKPTIDHTAFGKWFRPDRKLISNDGQFVGYSIEKNRDTTQYFLQSADHKFYREFINIGQVDFSVDSKFFIYRDSADINILNLKNGSKIKIPQARSFQNITHNKTPYIIYQAHNQVVIINLISNRIEKSYQAEDYKLDEPSKQVVLFNKNSAAIANLFNISKPVLLSEKPSDNYVFDGSGNQLSFICKDTVGGLALSSLWYFKKGLEKPILIVPYAKDIIPEAISFFKNNGKDIIFYYTVDSLRAKSKITQSEKSGVTVWSTKQSVFNKYNIDDQIKRSFVARVNILSGDLLKIDNPFDGFIDINTLPKSEFVVINPRIKGGSYAYIRETENRKSNDLLSLRDGSRRTIIEKGFGYPVEFVISPDDKYVVYFNIDSLGYYSYNIGTGVTKRIDHGVNYSLNQEHDEPIKGPYGIAGWTRGGAGVMVYDQYDIWEIDLDGRIPPKNLTGGYGRMHHTVLRIIQPELYLNKPQQYPLFKKKDVLMLSAFNLDNKDNGFYRLNLDNEVRLKQLTMGPYLYYYKTSENIPFDYADQSCLPVKARDKEVYLVQRMSEKEAPDLFLTSDFLHFNRISKYQPQLSYNWLSTQLLKWQMSNGQQGMGILYKPENFDPRKKYPVIFFMYEKGADELHNFLYPNYSNGFINIPWYVSNGYLVFRPNIYYGKGEIGACAFEAVDSASDYLSQLPFVDAKKMGLQGFSFGGFETNYIVTRTNRFTAAAPGAGVVDQVTMYNSLTSSGVTRQALLESYQSRMGGTLWQSPGAYLNNSPILNADKVNTPMLILHNEEDGSVPFSQGIAWFTALTRLRKTAWMLHYDGSGHGLFDEASKDYTTKLEQFFGFYLKNQAIPKWMVESRSN